MFDIGRWLFIVILLRLYYFYMLQLYRERNNKYIFDLKMYDVPVPIKSHFNFQTPIDLVRWKRAQYIAASGEPHLLEHILQHFPEPSNFLDGDIKFRLITSLNDIFVDDFNERLNLLKTANSIDYCSKDSMEVIRRSLPGLTHSTMKNVAIPLQRHPTSIINHTDTNKNNIARKRKIGRKATDKSMRGRYVRPRTAIHAQRYDQERGGKGRRRLFHRYRNCIGGAGCRRYKPDGNDTYLEDLDPDNFVPCNTSYTQQNRAPIVGIGYFIFNRTLVPISSQSEYFTGKVLGHADMMRRLFLWKWLEINDEIATPYIISYINDENAGPFSTVFPNRTVSSTYCCDTFEWDLSILPKLLEDKRLLMLLSHQSANFSHPKLLTLPRGLPVTSDGTERVLWDAMHAAAKTIKKHTLLYSASSNWHTSTVLYTN